VAIKTSSIDQLKTYGGITARILGRLQTAWTATKVIKKQT
jgi:hypothetical protein